jgi:hypothetical protein
MSFRRRKPTSTAHVLRPSTDLTSGYSGAMPMNLPIKWAIDGVPFQFKNEWFFVWPGWAGNTNVEQNLTAPACPIRPR